MDLFNVELRERRESPRINLETKVSFRTSPTAPYLFGWVQNISRGGFKLKADNPLIEEDIFKAGREIYFETSEDFFKLKGKGEIIWASERERVAGVKFGELDQKGRHFLENFLNLF
ncbi:MAG: PilZ domain-containing protein [Desulfobacterota bacterium]|nr:PilZ domain-containing protein [Thermodesulfobacteriota bacterium]